MNILVVFGTRPEAIKMAPLVLAMQNHKHINCKVCVTGQHQEMLDQVLKIFRLKPDFNLNIMEANQDIFTITQKILAGMKILLQDFHPDLLMVHGDTASTLGASLAAFFSQIPVAHIEAGLRTGNLLSPWPEEGNRKLVAAITKWHFAATKEAKRNLLNENVAESNIFITGNTVIDALLMATQNIEKDTVKTEFEKKFPFVLDKQFILVTAHRRENIGQGIHNIAKALKEIAEQNPNINIIYPVHKNPNIKKEITKTLQNISNIILIEPLDYLDFVFLMKNCFFILTDSGGIQEEAPTLGKPVLVMRESSERKEAIDAGTVKLVGTEPSIIVKETNRLIHDPIAYDIMAKSSNPYGDGTASEKIISSLLQTQSVS